MFILDSEKHLVQLEQQPYESEDLLQEFLASHPDLLGSNGTFRLMLVGREVSVPDSVTGRGRWSLDHLYLDDQGVPTLVETKKASNRQIRREVVGQMLDYAANAVEYWPLDGIRKEFQRQCAARGIEEAVALKEAFGDDPEIDTYWQRVNRNLREGRIRMVFVADVIPDELRAIVEFLGKQVSPAEVVAVEIGQHVGAGIRAFVPSTVAGTRKTDAGKTGSEGAALPGTWEEALERVEDEGIKALMLEESASRRGNPRIRKIYYDCRGARRWRIQVQKRDVNIYQTTRFAGDLRFWADRFPGVQLRTPESGTALAFNLGSAADIRRFLDVIEREGPSLEFVPARQSGETVASQ